MIIITYLKEQKQKQGGKTTAGSYNYKKGSKNRHSITILNICIVKNLFW